MTRKRLKSKCTIQKRNYQEVILMSPITPLHNCTVNIYACIYS